MHHQGTQGLFDILLIYRIALLIFVIGEVCHRRNVVSGGKTFAPSFRRRRRLQLIDWQTNHFDVKEFFIKLQLKCPPPLNGITDNRIRHKYCNHILLVPFFLNSAQKNVNNWIIRLMLSLLCCPKVILLSGGHCSTECVTFLYLRTKIITFWVTFDHFWSKQHFLRQLGQWWKLAWA